MTAPGEFVPGPLPVEQPFLHNLVTCMKAPTVALSGTDGQIVPGGVQGVMCYDRRVLSELVVRVDGYEPVPVGHSLDEADDARFVGIIRHLGDLGADPTVWLERRRRTRDHGMDEHLQLVNLSRRPISVAVTVQAAVDLAGVIDVKHGVDVPNLARRSPPRRPRLGGRPDAGHPPLVGRPDGRPDRCLAWEVEVPARTAWEVDLALDVTTLSPMPHVFRPAAGGLGWDPSRSRDRPTWPSWSAGTWVMPSRSRSPTRWRPDDVFVAGGSPWFLTLFGRDSLWAAQLTLPLGTDLARGTLRTLARRQGRAWTTGASEAPGKMLHEVRARPRRRKPRSPGLLRERRRDGAVGLPAARRVALGHGSETSPSSLGPMEAALAWIVDPPTATATASSNTSTSAARAWRTRGGRTPAIRSSSGMAPWPRPRSR